MESIFTEQFYEALEFLGGGTEKIRKWDEAAVGSFICMVIEEWCAANNESAPDFAQKMADIIAIVNVEEGTYDPNGGTGGTKICRI